MPTAGAGSRLIERDGELAVLERLVDGVVGGAGAFAVAEGPPGIGKTRLLEATRHLAETRGFTALRARGGELERDFAYGVVRQLFERRLREAPADERARLLTGAAEPAGPALGLAADASPPVGDAQFAVTHGLYWLAASLAAGSPVLLEVDDAHWGDPPSLRFLAYLVARLSSLPVLVVAATRPGEPGATPRLVDALCSEPSAVTLHPSPLSTEGVRSLATDRLGQRPDDDFTAACEESTGGNPFYLGELLEALAVDGVSATADGASHVRALGPRTVSRSLLLRLTALPGAATPLVRAVAVLGARAELGHAAQLAGVPRDAAEEAVDGLIAAAVLAPQHPLRFTHPILREAVYADLGLAQRSRMHAEAARILEASGLTPGEVAPHLLATQPAGDPAVSRLLGRAAADALDQGAPEVARRALRRALEEPPAAADRPHLLAKLGESELRAGSYAESGELLGEAIASQADPAERVRLTLLRVYALLASEGSDAAIEVLERTLEDLGDGQDSELGQLVLAELCAQALLGSQEGHPALARIPSFAEAGGSTRAERRLLALAALQATMGTGDARRCADLARRALADGLLIAEETATSAFYFFAVTALTFAEAGDDARRAIDTGRADTAARGAAWDLAGISSTRAMLDLATDLAAAEAEARVCVEHAIPSMVGTAASLMAMVLLERGDLEGAERELAAAGLEGDDPQWRSSYWLGPYGRGRVRLARGRALDALADFDEVGRRATAVGGVPAGLAWRPYRALALSAAGRDGEALAAADEALRAARDWGAPGRLGLALRVRGLVDTGDARIRWLREAEAQVADSPARLEHAHALHDLGVALARAGQRAEARELLRRAVDAARGCAADGLAQSALDELRVAGARPRAQMFSGPEALTASERRVAELAAEGRTNRQISEAFVVTVKTVENHLGRVYGKLGISSREQLAEALGER